MYTGIRSLVALGAALLTAVVVVAGCGSDDDASAGGEVVVSAATSLKAAFTSYGETFTGAEAQFSFAGSDELAAQIRAGARPDVFASANTKLPDELFEEGLLERPQVFAANRLVLAVPAAGGGKVRSLPDLRNEGVTLVIGAAGVPIGAYTRTVLGRLDGATRARILANVRSNEPDVGGISAKLTQGAADAGFLYATDVVATKGRLKAIELPRGLQPQVAYGIAIVKGAAHPDDAREFVAGLLDGAGSDALRAAGFTPGVRAVTRGRWFAPGIVVALAVALTFLTLPVVAIFVRTSPGNLLGALDDPGVLDALWLSLRATLAALVIVVVVGTPAAYLLATRTFRGHAVVTTLVELPLVLPPAVAGVGLLAALGPSGIVGGAIGDAGVRLVFETAGVVVALTFVSAPFFIRGAQAAFGAVDRSWLEASRTLGAGEARTFLRVAIPAAAPGMLAGLALAWGRAVGEFGATLIFAGSFRGRTQTAPLAIYERLGTDFDAALALSAVLVAVSGSLLLAAKLLGGRGVARAAR